MTNQKSDIGFSLLKITTEQFATIEEGFNDKGTIRVSTSLKYGADDQNKLIAVFASFIFDSNQKPFIIVEASCQFKVKTEAWISMYKSEEKSILVPKGFLSHLAVITVGATRGILHSKTEGTCFNKYVLPTINVSEIIKEDVVFNFILPDELNSV